MRRYSTLTLILGFLVLLTTSLLTPAGRAGRHNLAAEATEEISRYQPSNDATGFGFTSMDAFAKRANIMGSLANPMAESIQTFASNCTTPKTDFNIGDTVCAVVTGANSGQFVWRNHLTGCNFPEQTGPTITMSPQSSTYTLSATDTTPGGPCDTRGVWKAIGDTAETEFRVHDPNNAAADLTASVIDQCVCEVFPQNADSHWSIDVGNRGPDAAQNVTLTDPLSANTTFVSLTSPAGWVCSTPSVGSTGTVSCTKTFLAPLTLPFNSGSTSEHFVLTVHVPNNTPANTVIDND